MNARDMLNDMMARQDALNTKAIGPGWRDYDVDWRLTVFTECAELLDSLNNYWWKKTDIKISDYSTYNSYLMARTDPIDLLNVKVELVDIWHFLLSELMNRHNSEDLLRRLTDRFEQHTTLEAPESLGQLRGEIQMGILALYPKLFDDTINHVDAFLNIVDLSGMTIEDLYKLYVGKATLNTFRQDNGYKTGEYTKLWTKEGKEVEDNVVMFDLLMNTKVEDLSELYAKLETAYAEVT